MSHLASETSLQTALDRARREDFAGALEACERAIGDAPDAIDGYLAKGRILRAAGADLGVALRAFRKATECGGPCMTRAAALMEYAFALEPIGRHREAAQALEEALAILPALATADHRALVLDLASHAHERAGQVDLALKRLREAAALRAEQGRHSPDELGSRRDGAEALAASLAREADLLERLGRVDELFPCYKRLVETAPDRVLFAQPDETRPKAATLQRWKRLLHAINAHLAAAKEDWVARIVKAGFFFRLGRYRQAEALLQEALATGPDHFYAHHLLGKIRLKQGRATQALEALDRARALGPLYADLVRDRALALEACDRRAEAVEAWMRIDERWPAKREASARASRLLEDLGRLEEAYETAKRAASLAPAPELESQERLASLAARLKRPRDAAAHLTACLALETEGGRARALRLARAAALTEAGGELVAALEDATAALAPQGAKAQGDAADGLHREALALRASLLVRLDRGEEALAAAEALAALEGESDERTLVLLGDALRAAKRFPESVQRYKAAADRRLADALMDAGARCCEQNEFGKALGRFNESFRRHPQGWEVLYFAAAAYGRLSQASPAAKYLAAAAKVNPGALALMERDRDFDAVRESAEILAVKGATSTAATSTAATAAVTSAGGSA